MPHVTFLSITDIEPPVLIVAPHPDDETLGCGGLIALASQKGLEVHVLFVTDGSASHPASKECPPEAMAVLRADEADEALRRLGARHQLRTFLRLRDGAMPKPGSRDYINAVDKLVALFSERHFRTVVTPWRRDPHTDHRISWQIAIDAIEQHGQPLTLLEYQVWLAENGTMEDWPETGEVEEFRLDVTSVFRMKRDALAAHRSQLGLIVTDDPQGFVLSAATIARLITDHEIFWVSRWPGR